MVAVLEHSHAGQGHVAGVAQTIVGAGGDEALRIGIGQPPAVPLRMNIIAAMMPALILVILLPLSS